MKQIAILPVSLYVFLFCLSFSFKGSAQLKTDTYTNSNTNGTATNYSFVAPAGVTSVTVQAWGAGGGGASRNDSGNGGGGGGGGAYASSSDIAVTPGISYPIVVGGGGPANSPGGASSFNSNTVIAAGGNGAANNSTTGATGGLISNSTGETRNSGGNGGDGGSELRLIFAIPPWYTAYHSGGGGGGAGSTGNGHNASGETRGNARTVNGGAGAAGVWDNTPGTVGGNYGGGGSGGVNRAGGRGANGLVTLDYTCPTYSLTSLTVTPSVCPGSPATVKLHGTTTNLPAGQYTVRYTQNGGSSTTTNITVSTEGEGTSGTFTTPALTTTTSIEITNLRSGSSSSIGFCDTDITSNNTAIVHVGEPNAPTIGDITQPDCTLATGSVELNDLPTGSWTLTRNDGATTTGSGTTAIINGLNPGTYTYTVTGDETSTSCSGLGTGLHAEYFNNMTLTGPAALTRTDATVNFPWGTGNPGSPINNDNFSVRWTGQIQPCYGEDYTFYTFSDDGVRLWIDGDLVINDWNDYAAKRIDSEPISLVAGTKYDIVLEYYENGGEAVAQLYWSSLNQPYQIIPQGQLFSEATGCTSTNSSTIVISPQPNCWVGDHDSNWNNPLNWVTGVPTSGTEATLNTIIHSGSPNYPVIYNGAASGYINTIVIENNARITVMDNSLRITESLKLDGKIDLEGESQLLQDLGSTLDPTSSGTIEIDQQGTQDLYTYNYWSSPVGVNPDNSYTLAGVLKDGSVPSTPLPITFLPSGHDGIEGVPGVTPISIAHYWIHKYNATSNTYSAWQRIRSTGNLKAGEGFTMKGVANTNGAVETLQNYVFVGKPNNGDITLPITAGNDYLVGNPYPSALDADEFILDNIADGAGRASQNIINGALYFWDHFGGGTHNLADYQGGYATYTLMGGAVAISSDTRINATGISGTKESTQYIPVAQGFFVSSVLDPNLEDDGLTNPVVGGTITFKNSQRVFATESSGASQFMKQSNTKAKSTASKQVDSRQKIRLMFDSPKGYHRQLLVGVDERASNGFDLGFDAPLIETNKEDMFWIFKNNEFVIQAVNNFDEDQILPLGVKTSQAGISKIKIDGLENIPSGFNIYLNDKELGIYHPIHESPYEVYLEPGDYLDRFEVTFKSSGTLDVDEVNTIENLQVYFSNNTESIIVHNPVLKQIKSVELVNLLGQSIHKFNENTTKDYLEYKTNQISSGVYIIKVQTPEGSVSKKVLIK